MRFMCAVTILCILSCCGRAQDTIDAVEDKLIPVPSDSQLKAGVTNLKSLYASDYRGAEGKAELQAKLSASALARKLLTTAEETPPSSDGYYPMLSEAIWFATLSNKPDMALGAIDKLAKTHKIDTPRMRHEVLAHFAQKTTSLTDVKAASRFVMPAVQAAADAQELDTAAAMLSVGDTMAKRLVDRTMQKNLTLARELLEQLQDQEAQVQEALKKIEQDQNDAIANLTVAKYLGLRKGNWEKAEVHAHRVDEEEVRSLFVRELVNPEDTSEILRLANDWWDFSATQTGAVKLQAADLALTRYASIVKDLKGFEQKQVASRLAGIAEKRAVAVRLPVAVPNTQPESIAAPVAPQWIDDGLVAYYPFNRNARDESGSGGNGTLEGGQFSIDRHNKPNSCLELREVGDAVTVPPYERLNSIKATEHTVSFWVSSGDTQHNSYMVSRNAQHNYQWSFLFSRTGGDKSSIDTYTMHGLEIIGAQSCKTSIGAAGWNHAVFSTSPDSTTIYVNGASKRRVQPGIHWPALNAAPLLIGRTNDQGRPVGQFLGKIDDIRIYDRPLSDEEAKALFEFEKVIGDSGSAEASSP